MRTSCANGPPDPGPICRAGKIAMGLMRTELKPPPAINLTLDESGTGRMHGEIFVWTPMAGRKPSCRCTSVQPAWGFAGSSVAVAAKLVAERDRSAHLEIARACIRCETCPTLRRSAENRFRARMQQCAPSR